MKRSRLTFLLRKLLISLLAVFAGLCGITWVSQGDSLFDAGWTQEYEAVETWAPNPKYFE